MQSPTSFRDGLIWKIMAVIWVTAAAPITSHPRCFASPPPAVIGEGRTVLNELAQISIDAKNTFKVREINIDRDALHLTLHRGILAFFTPVRGRVTGAVFVGDGEILVIPPDRIERFQLNRFTDSPVLTERFSSAVFRFTDNTFEEITRSVPQTSPLEPVDLSLRTTWDDAVRSLSLNLNYRLLQNLLSTRPHRFFHAAINGLTFGWFEAVDDDRAYEPVLLGRVTKEQGVDYPDVWCSFRNARFPQTPLAAEINHLQQYDMTSVGIDAEIGADARLTATARVELKSLTDDERVLAFELSRGLKVNSVEDGRQHPLEFFQNSLLEANEVSQRGNDVVYVLLHQVTRRNEPLTLVFKYSGDVITNLGNGIYYVGARGTWYPNHGLSDVADYHLTFHYPSTMTLVATGSLLKESSSGSTKVSEWQSDGPAGVAGFNYGEYLTRNQTVNGVDVEVFANKGLETVVQNLQARLEQIHAARVAAAQTARPRGLPPPPTVLDGPIFPAIDTQTLLTNVINDAGSALQFFESWFGAYPYKKLAISQIPGQFGQGWPSLCYVSTITFLTSSQQQALGLSQDSQVLFSQLMRAHEIAHQWWGNLVSIQSYHDTWLMEGMANYAALLYAASKDSHEKDFPEAMQRLKSHLLEKSKGGGTIENAGPIWLGWRLYSSKTPSGYQDIVYDKGAWIIHMLRMMMRDSSHNSDEPFIRALKAFLVRYKSQPASTENFKASLERFMTPAMDLDRNHKLDWFFDEWVYDVGIPEYALKYSVTGSSEKGYSVSGKILQSGVSGAFEMPLPLFAHYGNRVIPLGTVATSGSETSFHFHMTASQSKPSKITLNDNDAVLCVIKGK